MSPCRDYWLNTSEFLCKLPARLNHQRKTCTDKLRCPIYRIWRLSKRIDTCCVGLFVKTTRLCALDVIVILSLPATVI